MTSVAIADLGTAAGLLERLDEAVLVVDDGGSVVFANSGVRLLLGWEPSDLRGRPLVTIVPERLRGAHGSAFSRYMAGGEGRLIGRPVRLAGLHRDGSEVEVELLLSAGPAPGSVLGFLRDVRARVDVDGHSTVAQQLLRVLADRIGDGNAAARMLQAIGEGLGWDAAALWVVERGVRHLRCDAFWSVERADVQSFRVVSEGTLLPVGIGLPGRVWESGESAWITDIGTDMNFPRAAAAAAAGLRSAFAFPVLAGGRFMGVIELLDRSARQADRNLVETMTGIGGLLGELLERERQDDERDRLLRRLETERARLEAVQRRMPAGVLVADAPSGRVVAGNDKLDDLVGAPLTDDAEGERFLTYPFRRVDGTPYDHHEMPFAEAARTGTVIENAELEFQQPDGEIRLVSVSAAPVHDRDGNVVSAVATFHDVTDRRRAEDRHRFLSEASAVLASSLDHNATLAAVARLAIGVLGDVIGVHLIGADGKLRQVVAEFSDPELAIVTERIRSYGFDAAANEGVARVLRKGTSVVYEEVDAELLRAVAVDDEHLALLSRLRARSAMLIPLVSGPRVLGALSFVSLQPQRVFDHDAVSLAEELGRRAGVAVANARLYERERAVAAALQASLLPRRLPQVPGLELAARFHPGGEGVEVGGDFYDAFPIGAEAAALVVGDVCGKGAEAAALTAQFRYTARALSGPGRDPGTVLGLVDAKVQEDDGVGDRFCTAVYALVERGPHGFACSVASAGHPLPLVVRASGAVEELACSGSLLFVLARPTYQVVSFTLRPGDSLVLYTDGVTEARGEHGWFGADRLRSLLASRAGASADELAGAVADAALAHSGGRADDDIAVLVAVARP